MLTIYSVHYNLAKYKDRQDDIHIEERERVKQGTSFNPDDHPNTVSSHTSMFQVQYHSHKMSCDLTSTVNIKYRSWTLGDSFSSSAVPVVRFLPLVARSGTVVIAALPPLDGRPPPYNDWESPGSGRVDSLAVSLKSDITSIR
jgi:hypothetical protein